MPLLELTTNTKINNCPQIAQQVSKLAAEILGKPESYVMIKIQPAHIQEIENRPMNASERDVMRANLIKEIFQQ